VLARGRQASDRLTAAVAQVVADIDQNSAVRAAQMERAGLLWRFGAWGLAGLGVVVALWSALLLWGGVRGRLRRLTAAVVEARDDTPVVLGPREGRPDEIEMLARAVERLDSERRRLAGARRDQASRLAAVFATLPDAVLLLAADHTVADASPAAEGLLGRSVSALLGRPLENVLPAPAAAAVADAVAAALARPEAPPTAVAVSLPDPTATKAPRPATVFAGAFADPAGPGPVGVAVIRVGAALSDAGVEGDRSDAATGDGDDGTPDAPADSAGGLSHAS
jgi:PAS domain-containing protein